MTRSYRGKTLYHATRIDNLKSIIENGLEPSKSQSKQKAVYLADSPDAALQSLVEDQKDLVLLEVTIDDLDLFQLSSNKDSINEYMRAACDADLEEYMGSNHVPWSITIQKTGQIVSNAKIEPHVIRVSKYLFEHKNPTIAEGSILNPEYAKTAWKNYGKVRRVSSNMYVQNFPAKDDGERILFSRDISDLFSNIGSLQRGLPEQAMLDAQKAMGSGGVLCFLVEHVGDIYHRMTHHATYGTVYHELVADKVEKTLRVLNHPYGFEKEYRENLESLASYTQKTFEEVEAEASLSLQNYANEHSKLPTYNKAQWLSREASIALGEQDFNKARLMLSNLNDMVKNPAVFISEATRIMRTKDGTPIEYDGYDHCPKQDNAFSL